METENKTRHRWTSFDYAIRFSWILSLVEPLILIVWQGSRSDSKELLESFGQLVVDGNVNKWTPEMKPILVAIVVGAVGCVGVVMGMARGATRWRSIRVLLGLMVIVACWLGAVARRDEVEVFGLWLRVWSRITPLENFVQDVETEGDTHVAKGYNSDSPQFIPGTPFQLWDICRSPGASTRLELEGSDSGYWLERRFDREFPHSFFGDQFYYVLRWSFPVTQDWYLVEYITIREY
jgi:hypothetical protein